MTNSQPKRKVPCEVYSRIVGYLRPVQNWNKGKKQEFADRRPYKVQTGSERESANADQGSG
jgi:anaerobic ribonucleoside-triphosphate reductase